ncbi:hypothetical protein [Streptomyces sp. NPDC048350]|uniref:hypothetical protein n=1 Tax=Streptomyces sp. NPDC048350 TaxID=3365538 RepID=UPI003719762E
MAHTTPRVLVVGDVTHPDGLATVTALAHEVADRMQLPAVIAQGREYDVTQFEGVVYDELSVLDSVDSVVLWIEALEADMPVMAMSDVEEYDIPAHCGWCGAQDDESPVLRDGVWHPADVCAPCVEGAREDARRQAPVAA